MDRKMTAVDVKTGAGFEADTPKALFDTRVGTAVTNRFDVSRDSRFLIPVGTEQDVSEPLTVAMNWTGLLKKQGGRESCS